jgi:Flp pilus assembly protein TadG
MQRKSPERGQTLLMFTIALPVVIGMLGLVVDLGWAYFTKEQARAAAEAAALAGAWAAQNSSGGNFTCGSNNVVCQTPKQCPNPVPSPTTNDIETACAYAKDNGFAVATGGTQNVMVAAGIGTPPTVAGLSVPYWVSVTVTQSLPQTFSAILGNKFSTVSVRATATYLSASGGCLYLLNPHSTAISMSGTPTIQSGCGIYVNSDSSAAVLMSGTPQIVVTGGETTHIVGNFLSSGTGTISPAPILGGSPTPDPFASLTPPSVGSCTSTGVNWSGSGPQTLNPGVYCGAINISGTISVTMNPGLYILKAGITVSGGVTMTGNGVTLYVPSGGISMSGGGGLNLTAPSTGIYSGIVIYQDRSNTSPDALSGGVTQILTGVVYMPKSALTYSGGSGTNATSTTIVADSVTFSGNTYIKKPAVTSSSPTAIGATLIE